MDFLQSFIQYVMDPSPTFKPIEVKESQHCRIYRDEYGSKKRTAPVKVKKKVRFESKPLIQRDEAEKNSNTGSDSLRSGVGVDGQESGVRVKVLMTREEAARLLSKCKEGGSLEFKDAAKELVQIPSSRVQVLSRTSRKDN